MSDLRHAREGGRGEAAARIRPAVAADLSAVAAIAEAAFAPYVPLIGRRPSPMDADFAAALAAGELLVADDGGGAVGYAHLSLGAAAALLEAVGVTPARQGEGIGRALIAAAEARARQAGAPRLALYTNARMTANLALYPRLGYVETGRSATSGFDRVHFEKSLAPAMVRRAAVDGLYGRRRVHGHGIPDAFAAHALALDAPFDPAALFGPVSAVRLEVGFGGGEHLLHEAARHGDVGHIGAEPFETGVRRLVQEIDAAGVRNVRLYNGDARRVIEWLPAAALDRVDVLYPDPWHKQRHWKRRFISAEMLDRIARVLAPGGSVRFASDIAGYVAWTRAHVAAHPRFVLEGDTAEPWEGWPGTRYEAKARREGRESRYLTLRLA